MKDAPAPVLLAGDPLLRQKAVAASDPTDPALHMLAEAMLVTMLASEGVGIAAPQIGHSLRLIIIASKPNSRYPDAPVMETLVMVNPEIIRASDGLVAEEEGCLSVPGVRLQVLRHQSVEVRWQTLDGDSRQQEMNGFISRIVQHELDHLEGILFPDRVAEQSSSSDFLLIMTD
ncbi:MAG: peptide deformylase [Geobacter sp.]|nr:peptide deformylase [Geobacter sp.]